MLAALASVVSALSPRFGARDVSLLAWSHLSSLAGSELLFDALHAVLRDH